MTEKIKLFIVKKFNSNLFILLVRENKHRKNGNMNNLCILPSFRFESFLFAFSWNIYELKQIPPGKTYNSLKFLHIYIQPAAICDGTILRDAGLIFTAAAEEHKSGGTWRYWILCMRIRYDEDRAESHSLLWVCLFWNNLRYLNYNILVLHWALKPCIFILCHCSSQAHYTRAEQSWLSRKPRACMEWKWNPRISIYSLIYSSPSIYMCLFEHMKGK